MNSTLRWGIISTGGIARTFTRDLQLDGHEVTAVLQRVDETKKNLSGRGFHWVSERPFNR